MKFLVVGFVIAFILENHGIFSAKPIDQCSPDEQIELFKKYALKLVNAAAKPLRDNEVIMKGGCECVSGIDTNIRADCIDVVVATMMLASDYHEELQLMLANNEVELEDGLMESIRLILVVLQSSPEIFDDTDGVQTFKRYLFKGNRDSSASDASTSYTSGESDESFDPVVECVLSLRSMDYGDNTKFFDKLITGAKIANAMMRDDGRDSDNDPIMKGRRAELDKIIETISKDVLKTPPADYNHEAVEELHEILSKSNANDSNADSGWIARAGRFIERFIIFFNDNFDF